jgi:uncharacterized protein (DUF433 family)
MKRKRMAHNGNGVREVPAYGIIEVATYLRTPRKTIEYWVSEPNPVICVAERDPLRFSFMNLLECHIVSAIRAKGVGLHKIRRAVRAAVRFFPAQRPLLDLRLHTDRVDVFIKGVSNLLNLSRDGQYAFRPILDAFLQRIEPNLWEFFPFVERQIEHEPKIICIDPRVAFGRPVIAGTGITTAIIASRFAAREPLNALAQEYGRNLEEIEEVIRWERRPQPQAAA